MTQPEHHDPEVERRVEDGLLRGALERLRTGRDPLMREVAADLLGGRVALSEIGNSPDVAGKLQASVRHYQQWRQSMTDEEFTAVMGRVERHVNGIRKQIEDERDANHGQP